MRLQHSAQAHQSPRPLAADGDDATVAALLMHWAPLAVHEQCAQVSYDVLMAAADVVGVAVDGGRGGHDDDDGDGVRAARRARHGGHDDGDGGGDDDGDESVHHHPHPTATPALLQSIAELHPPWSQTPQHPPPACCWWLYCQPTYWRYGSAGPGRRSRLVMVLHPQGLHRHATALPPLPHQHQESATPSLHRDEHAV